MDSPRKPVWQILLDGKVIAKTTGYLVQPGDYGGIEPPRCLCGAKPTPNGDLPCGH